MPKPTMLQSACRLRSLKAIARPCYARKFSQLSLLDELFQRGLVAEATRKEALETHLSSGTRGVYLGFDPTAQSLHVGHILPLMCLLHFRIRGHATYPLIGGATGLVGDPSGRTTERDEAVKKKIEQNVESLTAGISGHLERFTDYAKSRRPAYEDIPPAVRNNLAWYKDMNLLDFLRTVGRKTRVNTMMSRQSVASRLASAQGLNYAEFTYQLLQAYDFYTLFTTQNPSCSIQIGGADQWGNIVSGLELINRSEDINPAGEAPQEKGFGVITPLLTTSSGEKFGKSAGNAVWLDEKLTSVFDFYQFFLKTTDADVEKYLKLFTLLGDTQIAEVMNRNATEVKHAQKRLAEEVTEMVHGQNGLRRAQAATKVLFGTDYADIKSADVISALENDPRLVFCDADELSSTPVTKLAANFGLVQSNSAARKLVQSNGFSVNNTRISDPMYLLPKENLIDGRLAIIRAGKDKHLVLVVN